MTAADRWASSRKLASEEANKALEMAPLGAASRSAQQAD